MHRYRQAIGLDLGRTQARVVRVVRRGFGVAVRDAVTVPLPIDPAEASGVLQGLFVKRSWLKTPCVVGLRGEGVLMRVVQVPPADSRPADAIVADEVERFLGGSPSQSCRDHAESRGRGGRQVVFALMRTDSVLIHLGVPREAGLQIVDAAPAAVALYAAATWCEEGEAGVIASADVEERETEFVIGRGRDLRFVRHFPAGVASLQADAAPADAGGVRLPDWAEEFRACLDYYRAHHKGEDQEPRRLILAGPEPGDAARAAMEESAEMPVRRFAETSKALIFDGHGEYAVACGLALTALGAAPFRLSLLPAAWREEVVLRWQFKWWAAAGAAVLLALGAIVATIRHDRDWQQAQRSTLREQLDRLQGAEAEWRRKADERAATMRRLVPLRAAAWNNESVDALLAALSAAKHTNDWVTLLADAVSYTASATPSGGANTVTQPVGRRASPIRQYVVEGYTPTHDLSTVREMIGRLRAYPFITSADLLADDRLRADPARDQRWADSGGRLFALEIAVREP